MSESVILCEGYHDRAFWAGWLQYLRCVDPGEQPNRTVRVAIRDPWNITVSGGHFAFLSKSQRFVRIIPCHGKGNIRPTAKWRLRDRQDKALVYLVLNVDSDVSADDRTAGISQLSDDAVEQLLRDFGHPKRLREGEFGLDDGATVVSVVRWAALDDPAAGLPNQQTLERLVCAALAAAYPDRGPAVQGWIDSRPVAPDAGPKEFAWSHMAGWYAERACEGFYRGLWDDELVVTELESRLRECGAWRIAEALAE